MDFKKLLVDLAKLRDLEATLAKYEDVTFTACTECSLYGACFRLEPSKKPSCITGMVLKKKESAVEPNKDAAAFLSYTGTFDDPDDVNTSMVIGIPCKTVQRRGRIRISDIVEYHDNEDGTTTVVTEGWSFTVIKPSYAEIDKQIFCHSKKVKI